LLETGTGEIVEDVKKWALWLAGAIPAFLIFAITKTGSVAGKRSRIRLLQHNYQHRAPTEEIAELQKEER